MNAADLRSQASARISNACASSGSTRPRSADRLERAVRDVCLPRSAMGRAASDGRQFAHRQGYANVI